MGKMFRKVRCALIRFTSHGAVAFIVGRAFLQKCYPIVMSEESVVNEGGWVGCGVVDVTLTTRWVGGMFEKKAILWVVPASGTLSIVGVIGVLSSILGDFCVSLTLC